MRGLQFSIYSYFNFKSSKLKAFLKNLNFKTKDEIKIKQQIILISLVACASYIKKLVFLFSIDAI